MNTVEFLEEVVKSLKDAGGLSSGSVDITDAKLMLTVGLGSCETVNHSMFLAELVTPTKIAIHERTIKRPVYLGLCKAFDSEVESHFSEPIGNRSVAVKLDEGKEDDFSD